MSSYYRIKVSIFLHPVQGFDALLNCPNAPRLPVRLADVLPQVLHGVAARGQALAYVFGAGHYSFGSGQMYVQTLYKQHPNENYFPNRVASLTSLNLFSVTGHSIHSTV
jgi:hypothetical protein